MMQICLFNPLDNTEAFLSDPKNIALLLNIDWFKPYISDPNTKFQLSC